MKEVGGQKGEEKIKVLGVCRGGEEGLASDMSKRRPVGGNEIHFCKGQRLWASTYMWAW